LELGCNESIEFKSDNETAEVDVELQLFMQDKLTRVIHKEINSKIISKSRTTKDVTSIVKIKFAIFEIEGKREANLVFYYDNLNSIPSSSVE
jgi:hypothetical protein